MTFAHYFQLQHQMFQRHLRDFGIHPLLGSLLLVMFFIGGTIYLFQKSSFAPLIYAVLALGVIAKLSESHRNDFLKNCFPAAAYRPLRLLENGLAALPFVVMLVAYGYFWEALALTVSAIGLAFAPLKMGWSYSLPTPFGKRPFEFAMGFRKTWWFILLAYALTAISVSVVNFNLGVFALVLSYGICLSYYAELEDAYIVWAHKASPKAFLLQKALWGTAFSALLSLPIASVLCIFFSGNVLVILGIFALANMYLWLSIFGKYASFPQPLNLPYSLVLGSGFVLPPLLVILVPFFFIESAKRLKHSLV